MVGRYLSYFLEANIKLLNILMYDFALGEWKLERMRK